MKKQFLLFLALTFLVISCKKDATTQPEITTPVAEETAIKTTKTECYRYAAKNDTIALTLQLNDKNASGTLVYAFYEKDKNTGTYQGTFENNILLADYTFQSEGKESVRQVAFKIQDGKLLEGYGELNADGTKFKDTSKLTFNPSMPLTKLSCD
ncbi:MAG TPA: hypothetical protein PKH91_06825 [Flavobacterium sp.]|nr:hypothetical protein [Flavobacterium sp.]